MMMTRAPATPRWNKSPNAERKDARVRFISLQQCRGERRTRSGFCFLPVPAWDLLISSSVSPSHSPKEVNRQLYTDSKPECEWMVLFFVSPC